MAIRPVLSIPDPVLSRPCRPVGRVDDTARGLARDLLDTMAAAPHCVGLAANQLGVGLRAFAVDVTGHAKARSCHGAFVLFDGEVLVARDAVVAREGCMSVPDLTGDVARPSRLVLRGITPEGVDRVLEVDAFEARAVLHELDHLDGRLFLDRVVGADRVFPRKVYR